MTATTEQILESLEMAVATNVSVTWPAIRNGFFKCLCGASFPMMGGENLDAPVTVIFCAECKARYELTQFHYVSKPASDRTEVESWVDEHGVFHCTCGHSRPSCNMNIKVGDYRACPACHQRFIYELIKFGEPLKSIQSPAAAITPAQAVATAGVTATDGERGADGAAQPSAETTEGLPAAVRDISKPNCDPNFRVQVLTDLAVRAIEDVCTAVDSNATGECFRDGVPDRLTYKTVSAAIRRIEEAAGRIRLRNLADTPRAAGPVDAY